MRPWAESRADCFNQGGDLVSITDPYEQAFLQGNFTPLTPPPLALCMGVTTHSVGVVVSPPNTNTKKTLILSEYVQCVHLQ